jgi:hypothetical protein
MQKAKQKTGDSAIINKRRYIKRRTNIYETI